MYNFKHNNYHLKPKSSTIYTPKEISEFLFKLLKDKIPKGSLILDPCCGTGNLLKPWERFDYNHSTYGIDQDESLPKKHITCNKIF